MRQCLRVLLLMSLCALFAVAAGAQTPQAATAPQAVPTVTQFLATLSATPGEAPGTGLLPPSPKLASTVCTSNADCPTGQLCCYPCGRFGCDFVCMAVTTCPHFP
ncbi:MAG: hypothetical protein DMF53_14415 [Acidobacteria bacterium]|nr:MAG: hypothetical protein DMF53_14415 [Acidobacteriota bacterium]